MDGSDIGWGRPAEPAPRWRALLDRARLGGRPAEEAEAEQPPVPPEPLPRRASGNGYAGRAPAAGRPAERPYGAEPGLPADGAYRAGATYPVEPGYRVDPGPQAEPGYRVPPPRRPEPAYVEPEPPRRPEPPYVGPEPPRRPEPPESRYALLDNGYRHDPYPAESRYALLDNGYRPQPAYQPAPPPPPEVVPDRGYPARVEWRPQGAENDLERAAAVLRRDLGGPRVFAFANPKGGVHKTTATVLAAATVGSVRGRGVLAWDDNELRGTLGLRAGSARHARTIRHLISDLAHIEIKEGEELLEHLDDYLRHASDGSYDVLAGEESPRFAQRLDQFTVRRVLELLRRTHDVVCVDTGNNVESANWRSVMQDADQLVVTTVPREDAAFSADWMLDLLHEVGMGELADNAVTLISCPTPGRSPLQDDLERHFATRTRAVAVVPYDGALETGSSIEYHQLQPETRQAWLRAAAMMLEPFGR
ncbi:MinD/ParA family ATP-binding protein [Micromonospora deserti]|uniref:ATPase n=1 Tax=Micromonospora deserti TaxID=2070366 RepID=A0A2W2DNH4_9ACTN|nr:AAA family ATPase [Micromonospora deserti]PZG01298.1 ATPase [Micromonospora deserti]